MKALALIYRRELALAWSGGGGPLLALGFFIAVATMIPLAAGIPLANGPSPARLAAIAPAFAHTSTG